MRKKRGTATGALVAMVALLLPAAAMTTATAQPKIPRSNTIEEYQSVTSADVARILQSVRTKNRELAQTAGTGTKKKVFITLDFLTGAAYPKLFKLRGKSRHMEVWVAADRDDVSRGIKFPPGDCRNDDASRLRISDEKIKYFMRQFERNILPKESKWLSRAPKRNGSQSVPEAFFFPRELRLYGIKVDRQGHTDYWSGRGRRTITLIDNFRDENFYDTDNQNTLPRVIGFFAGFFAEVYDRNVMHIDSYNWRHLTGPNPPHSPNPDDPCTNAPAAPFTYESTFAHEFQHLLEYYADPDSELLWVDEGLAEYAMDLTNYSKPEATMDSIYWTEIQCFYGWAEQQTEYNPIPFVQAGPENSLTEWEDQTHPDELLCDYGMVYAFMEMLKDHYGKAFLRALHREDADGLEGLQNVLDNRGIAVNAMDLVDRFAALVAVDRAIDAGAMTHTGTNPATDYRSASLDAFLDWSNDDTYSTPGAPPNGSDYVRLRDGTGAFLTTDQINKLDFDGAELLEPDSVEWTVDADPPTAAKTDPALFSGSGPNFDRSIVQEVSVPGAGGNLTFDTYFDMEYQWDYGFVQVSTDNGQTWTSLSNNLTGIEPDPGADPKVVAQLPGLNGKSGATAPEEHLDPEFDASWVNTSFDLSPYAGQDILLGFRYITDALADNPGWWIDNVAVAGTPISDGSSLTGWQTISQVAPAPTNDFTLQIVAYDSAQTHVIVKEVPLDGDKSAALNNPELAALFEGVSADVVAAVVTYHDPTELDPRYAHYELMVNNVLQPGGS